MAHCKYYFEILFYVTFLFIKEKKIYNKKNPFAMPVASRKVHAEYHDPVGIRKVMDSCAVGCSHKLGFILISNVKY